MLIYNRWGELLFESRDKSKGWDGYFKNKLTAKDVYVYKLQLKFSDGRRETIAGDVTLLR
jgi:gliding motility-associated-like protein